MTTGQTAIIGLEATGRLTEEQVKKFIDHAIDTSVLSRTARVHCLRCGTSWPWEAPELACSCSNEDWTPDASTLQIPFVPFHPDNCHICGGESKVRVSWVHQRTGAHFTRQSCWKHYLDILLG